MRDTLPVRYMAISVDVDLKDEVAGGEGVMAGQAQLELDGAAVAVGVGLDERVAAQLHVAQLTCGAERGRANEREGLVAANSRIGIEGGQIDTVQPPVVYALEVGDQVVVADPDARFVEVVEHERVIAQPAGHGIEPSAAHDRVIPAPPFRVSLPAPPLRISLPVPPVMTLAKPLPVPVKLPLPVKMRFSRLAPSV